MSTDQKNGWNAHLVFTQKWCLCKNNLFIQEMYKTSTSWRNEAAETQKVQQRELQSPAPGVEQPQELACSHLFRKQLCREGRGSGWASNSLLQRNPVMHWPALGRGLPAVQNRWFLLSVQPWWETSVVLRSVQGFPLQDRHGYTGDSGRSPRWSRDWRTFHTEIDWELGQLSLNGRVRGILLLRINTWREGLKKMELCCAHCSPVTGKEGITTYWNTGNSI